MPLYMVSDMVQMYLFVCWFVFQTGLFSVEGEHYLIEPYAVGDSNGSVELNQSEHGIPHLLYSLNNSHRHLTNGNDSACGLNTGKKFTHT